MNNRILYISTDGGCKSNGTSKCIASYAYCILASEDMPSVLNIRERYCTVSKNKILREQLLISPIDCYEFSGLLTTENDPSGITPTNNRGEIMAIKKALEFVEEECIDGDILWISDSEYTQKSIDEWSRKWTADPIKHDIANKSNMDLILPIRKKIDELRKSRGVKLLHTRSHVPEPKTNLGAWIPWFMNERVDKLCARELS